jgi:ferredoxin
MITVDPSRCPQNHRCPMIPRCPKGAISQDGFGLPRIDAAKCIGCGLCVRSCPMQAMRKDNDG